MSGPAEQRRRLVSALAEAMVERGYCDTSVKDVLAASGLSRDTFYKHFGNVEGCFEAAHESALDQLFDCLEGACATEEAWPHRLGTAISSLLDLFTAQPAIANLLLVEAQAAGKEARARHGVALSRLAELLHEGGDAPAGGPQGEVEVALFGSLCHLLALRLRSGEVDRLPALAPELTELVLLHF